MLGIRAKENTGGTVITSTPSPVLHRTPTLTTAICAGYASTLLGVAAWSQFASAPLAVPIALSAVAVFFFLLSAIGLYAQTTGRRLRFIGKQHQLSTQASAHEKDRVRAESEARQLQADVQRMGDGEPIVRIGAVRDIARLADEALKGERPQFAGECVSILCTYLRLPIADGAASELHVRAEIVSQIAARLRNHQDNLSWTKLALNFTSASFGTADFSRCVFGAETTFDGATFDGSAIFTNASFTEDANFSFTDFRGNYTLFDNVNFKGIAYFDRATFAGGLTSFHSASFKSKSIFRSSKLMSEINFSKTYFAAAVSFEEADFLSGYSLFEGATFNSTLSLRAASLFPGALVNFSTAQLRDGVSFRNMDFAGGLLTIKSTKMRQGIEIDFREPQRWLVAPEGPWGDEPPNLFAAGSHISVLPAVWPPGKADTAPEANSNARGLIIRVPGGIESLDALGRFLTDINTAYQACFRLAYSSQDPPSLVVAYVGTGSLILELVEQYKPWVIGGGATGGLGILSLLGKTLVNGKVEQLTSLIPRIKTEHARSEANAQAARNERTRHEIEGVRLDAELKRVREEANERLELQQTVAPIIERIRHVAPNLELVPTRQEGGDTPAG
ncbi:pentapeptide repeat-containing protein [Rhodococcus sp. JG-3]|uniref:pentapeptide repeat-containing protein n=1 Tax=Rhodococcus sp. JG-3 TaxID=1305835 RepID=UPI00041B00EC|nr:pentapeptide repeat-containing protein [Rhodococcus sp. JG-3]